MMTLGVVGKWLSSKGPLDSWWVICSDSGWCLAWGWKFSLSSDYPPVGLELNWIYSIWARKSFYFQTWLFQAFITTILHIMHCAWVEKWGEYDERVYSILWNIYLIIKTLI